MGYYLGLDIGTSGTKALLITLDGRLAASDTCEYPLSTPRSLWAEQDPSHWWEAVVKTTRTVLSKSGIDSEQIACIGLSGQMHGSVFLDKNNRVLRPAILWCDQRTESECEWITRRVGQDNLAKLICNPVLTGFTAPKIVWLRNNEPEIYARVAKVLLPKDYIRHLLTGEFATDVSDASGTALFDVANRKWSDEVLAATDIPKSWMAECSESTVITGHVNGEAAASTGLAIKTPVVGGGGDQAAGAVGCGIVEPGIVSSTVGTSGVVFAYSETPAVDPKLRVHTFCHAVPGAWHTMGVILSAGGSLRWLRDTLYPSEATNAKAHGIEPYDLIMNEAMTCPAGSDGLIFLPYLSGERTPYPDVNARGTWFGMTLRTTRGHFARSVLEGVAFALNDTFEIFNDIGIAISEVRASGGGARSPLWRQIHADVTGRPHFTLAIEEGPALGAALLAAVGVGDYSTVADACRAVVKTGDSVYPDSYAKEKYARIYPVYKALYPALKSQFIALTRATEG